MFTIGTLSKRTGARVETIRYYERIDLLEAPPPRTPTARGTAVFVEADSAEAIMSMRSRLLHALQ